MLAAAENKAPDAPPARPPSSRELTEDTCDHTDMRQCHPAASAAAKLYINNVRSVELAETKNYFDVLVRKVLNYTWTWPQFSEHWTNLL